MSNVCTYCKETQPLGHYCQALLDMLDPCPWCRGPAVEWFHGTVCCADKDCPGFKALCSPEDWNRRATTAEAKALMEIVPFVSGQMADRPCAEIMMVADILARHGIKLPAEEGSDASICSCCGGGIYQRAEDCPLCVGRRQRQREIDIASAEEGDG